MSILSLILSLTKQVARRFLITNLMKKKLTAQTVKRKSDTWKG